LRLRGPYFAIGSLGLAIAAAEITITIDYVGGASAAAIANPSEPIAKYGPLNLKHKVT
jgi:hypothetical protein